MWIIRTKVIAVYWRKKVVTLADFMEYKSGANAILVPDSHITTYSDLGNEVVRVSELLSGIEMLPKSAISIVLPNSLEFMVMFLAVVRYGAIAAPLNSAYTAEEFKFYMEDAEAQAVIVPFEEHAAKDAARELGIQVIEVRATKEGAMDLCFDEAPMTRLKDFSFPGEDDVALFLHTSGTTSRPKGVPLTHKNLITSLDNIGSTYHLTSDDVAMVVMPLFHVHGLIGVALSTLKTGGTIVVPPRFSASKFWLDQSAYGATWYSAVPTIHQILLARAEEDQAPAESFRFIRSCSSALAPSVFADLESRFGAPVLEAYGMTEASHQMSSNLLPPGLRQPGTVGQGTGVELGIMDEAGNFLELGGRAEVVTKVANVTKGYHKNHQANEESFVGEWFRTGDQGFLDEKGVLRLTGRLKELINRGGEKISPLEVDAALLRHPSVAEAVCFGVPDQKYGEVVQAAVVLSENVSTDAIRSFCSDYLSDFKIPDKIYVLDTLPRTATGKIQRRHIAAEFVPQVDDK